MKGKVEIKCLGEGQFKPFKESGLPRGPLKMPQGVSMDGELIAFGEDEEYIHCVISSTGQYYGVFRSPDYDHFYQALRRANVEWAKT